MKRIKSFSTSSILVLVGFWMLAPSVGAQSIHNEQYIALQNYIAPTYAITFGAPTTLATNYTFLLPDVPPTSAGQTLLVTSTTGNLYTLGWGGTMGNTTWMLTGNAGLSDGVSNFLGTLDSTPVRFITKGITNERMRISATGLVGIGTNSPSTTLDVNGDFAERSTGLTLVNGNNNDIAIGGSSNVRISGPTAAFTITGIQKGFNGKRLFLYNTTGQQLTVANQSTSTSTTSDRIVTLTGCDLILKDSCLVELLYDNTMSRWLVASHNSKSVVSGSIGAVQFAIKSADESVTNSSTLQDDNDLFFTIGPNETWEVVAQLHVTAPDDDPKFKVAITIPSGSLHVFANEVSEDDEGAGEWLLTSGTASDEFHIDVDDESEMVLQGLVIGGTTGGTVHIQWSPDKSCSKTITVKKNSYLKATRAQ